MHHDHSRQIKPVFIVNSHPISLIKIRRQMIDPLLEHSGDDLIDLTRQLMTEAQVLEKLPGRRIKEKNFALQINHEDNVGKRFQNRSVPRFALSQLRFGAAPFNRLPDLTADVAQHFEQFVVRRAQLAAEKLDYPQEFAAELDGEGKSSMQPESRRNRRAGEMGVLADIGNPRRPAIEPDPPGQANARRKRGLLNARFKLSSFRID